MTPFEKWWSTEFKGAGSFDQLAKQAWDAAYAQAEAVTVERCLAEARKKISYIVSMDDWEQFKKDCLSIFPTNWMEEHQRAVRLEEAKDIRDNWTSMEAVEFHLWLKHHLDALEKVPR